MFRLIGMEYRCAATSVAGFVQQLVSCYLPHGYWFYVSGIVPQEKEPGSVDEKLLAKYGIGISRQSRARRKAVGIANVHYIRYQRRFLLLATHGHHPFYDNEEKSIRDARKIPIKFAGYSISVAKGGFKARRFTDGVLVQDNKWRVRVQIERGVVSELESIHARYCAAPVVSASLERISFDVLRFRRRIVRPFEPAMPSDALKLTVAISTGNDMHCVPQPICNARTLPEPFDSD